MLNNDIKKVQKFIDGAYAIVNKPCYERDLRKVQKYVDKMQEEIDIYSLTKQLLKDAERYAQQQFERYYEDPEFWMYY